MTSKFKGYTLGVIAAATYGMNPLFTLPLYKEGMDPNSVLFFRYLMALPIVAVMIKARRRDFCVNPRQLLPLSVLGLLMGLSSLALFVSYNYMEASIASTMLFVYPCGLFQRLCLLACKEFIPVPAGPRSSFVIIGKGGIQHFQELSGRVATVIRHPTPPHSGHL